MKYILTIIIYLSFINTAFSQLLFQENDTLEHTINQHTPKPILAKYLKSINAQEIVFSEALPQYYKIQNKKGKWQLWKLDYGEETVIHDKAYDEVFLPTVAQAISNFCIAMHKGRYVILDLEVWREGHQQPKFEFDSIVFRNKKEIEKINKENNKNVESTPYGMINHLPNPEFLVKKKGLWGLVLPVEDGRLFTAEPFIYKDLNDVPATKWDAEYQLPFLEDLYKKENIDLAQPVPQEIVYVTGRNKKTKKWGLYGGEGSFEELIKPAYDSIKMHEYPIVYEVWNNNRVGYYNEDFQEVLTPEFEDFNYFHLDYTKGCALYAEEFWQLYDCNDGKLLVEGKAKTLEELQELWLNR
ncbi:MAG: hypothetical protein WDZ45_01325 [Flavobacteriaceae bacterium]